MAHIRSRHIAGSIVEKARFWPVVGLLGARQLGKTTLLREQIGIENFVTELLELEGAGE